jgi:long-subunit acyl-CoA synthetase (AMP-forming)
VTCSAQYGGSIGGLLLPSTEISICDDAGNAVEARPQSGEICTLGPRVMVRYWHCADETAQVMTGDGLCKSGDIAVTNAGGQSHIVD